MADYLNITKQLQELSAKLNRKTIIIAVSKFQSVSSIQELYKMGQRTFAENYVQEFLQKKEELKSANSSLEIQWHFIGSLQKNKVSKIVGQAHLIHSVDSLSLLETIDRHGKNKQIKQKILLQLNLSNEESKGGFSIEEIKTQEPKIFAFDNIEINGLMTMPPLENDPESNRKYFQQLRQIRDELNKKYPSCTELSMGTSHDYLIAIDEGATMVRLGTILFGERKKT